MRFIYFSYDNNSKSYCLNADKIHHIKNIGRSVKIYLMGNFFPIKFKASSERVAIDFVDNLHEQLRKL